MDECVECGYDDQAVGSTVFYVVLANKGRVKVTLIMLLPASVLPGYCDVETKAKMLLM